MEIGNQVEEFADFFSDMFRHVVGKLTGFLSVLLALFPLIFPSFFSGNRGLLHNRAMWEVGSAIAFFLVAKSAWSEKVKALKLLEEELLLTQTPNFELFIEAINTAPIAANGTLLVLGLTATNRGAPSILRFRQVRVELLDGQHAVAKVFMPPSGKIILNGAPGTPNISLARENYFSQKALDRPVDKGGGLYGWACYVLSDTPPEVTRTLGNVVVVEFEDVEGKVVSASKEFIVENWERVYNPAQQANSHLA